MDLRFRADWKVTLVKAEELGRCRRLRMRIIKLLVNVSLLTRDKSSRSFVTYHSKPDFQTNSLLLWILYL